MLLWCLIILWKSGWMGGSLNLGILRGGGVQAVFEIQVEGRGFKKPCLPSGGVDFFRNLTHCHLICKIIA